MDVQALAATIGFVTMTRNSNGILNEYPICTFRAGLCRCNKKPLGNPRRWSFQTYTKQLTPPPFALTKINGHRFIFV